MTPITYIIDAMATYRLSRMIACENGPFDIFEHIRHSRWTVTKYTWVAEGLSCPLCVSFWIAFLIPVLPTWARRMLALSGLTCIIYSVVDFERYFKK